MTLLRIRTIARLTGIREATLRAWERRYGFPRPQRSENGYRAYSRDEVENVRRVAGLIAEGMSVSEAVQQVQGAPVEALPTPRRLEERFWSAVAVLDADAARGVLDEAEAALPPLRLCDELLLPLLRDMAHRLDVAREHLASGLVRQRLRALGDGVAVRPGGPGALLACPAGDFHEGGLLGLALHLRCRGWRTTQLGADTPPEALAAAVAALRPPPDVVALSFVRRRTAEELARTVGDAVRAAAPVPVVVGGAGAREHLRAVFAAGAQYAESPDELVAAWTTLRGASNGP